VTDLRPKVLVLDEDRLTLELYSRELSCDYQVTTCESVKEARQCLRKQAFHALIIEPALDDETWMILREVRAASNPPEVILCSVDDNRGTGLREGAYAFLIKPVLPTTLHSLLDQIMAEKSFQSTQRLERGS
jgi:DNA-binding response OmpR family regulator